jgi:hypothetical protein
MIAAVFQPSTRMESRAVSRSCFLVAALAANLAVLPPAAVAADELGRGIAALEAGNAKEALAILQPLADRGNADAQLRLALMYYNGHGVKENEAQAVELLRRSAKSGNVEAMYQLGNVFTFGQQAAGMVDDADLEAARWYHQAALAGNRDAQYSLGLAFMSGKGVVKDSKEAAYWMEKAAKAGHPDARSYVANGR